MISLTQALMNFIATHGLQFGHRKLSRAVHDYNNFQMPITDRIKKILEEKDMKFIEFLKNRKE